MTSVTTLLNDPGTRRKERRDAVPGHPDLRCVVCRPHGEMYERVIRFAAACYGLREDEVRCAEDGWSDIFALLSGDEVVATISTTRIANGPIEAGEFYPRSMLRRFGAQAGTAFRLAASGGRANLGLVATRVAIAHAVENGTRLALISVKPTMTRWYVRMGFELLSAQPYRHPRLGTEHVMLYCPFDPARRSAFADLFEHVDEPLTDAEVRRTMAGER